MCRVCSVHASASGVEIRRCTWRTPPSNTRYSAHVPGIVLHARHLDPRHRPWRRTGARGCGACGRRSSRGSRVGGRRRRRGARSRRGGCRSSRRARWLATPGSTRGGGRTRAPAGRRRRPGRRATRAARAGTCPVVCRGIVGVEQRERDARRGRPLTARRRRRSRRGSASWLPRTWCSRSPNARRSTARNAAYSSSCPSQVRSPFTITASGSSAAISATAPRFIISGYGSAPGATREDRPESRPVDDPALGLAEVHVVHGGERRQPLAAGRGSVRNAKPSSVVLGVGLEVVVATDVGAVVDDGLVVGDGRQLGHRSSALDDDGLDELVVPGLLAGPRASRSSRAQREVRERTARSSDRPRGRADPATRSSRRRRATPSAFLPSVWPVGPPSSLA